MLIHSFKTMRVLKDEEAKEGERWMQEAATVAARAMCFRSRCGSVIVRDGEVVATGFNAPPQMKEEYRTCLNVYDLPKDFAYDRTCCIHAEERAIMNGLKSHPEKLKGARLYFVRLDNEGKIRMSGKPICTLCSRMTLEAGIAEFVLWHAEGITVYEAGEYDKLSFANTEHTRSTPYVQVG